MIATQPVLNERHIGFFDRFLLDGTGKVLNALETMYEFDIEQSESSIEIGPANDSAILKHLGSGVLYTITSALLGDVRGSIQLMMRSVDFDYMGELMKPVLSLLFLSSPDTELKILDSQKPEWMEDHGTAHFGNADFQAQMMDAVAEMGNVLIGLYTKAIYNMCALNTHHSMPLVARNADQSSVQKVFTALEIPDQLHVVIENEILVRARTIRFWCVISLTQRSFQDLLGNIEHRNEHQRACRAQSGPVQNRTQT